MFTPEAAGILEALYPHYEARKSIRSFIANDKILADQRVISGIWAKRWLKFLQIAGVSY
jgi:hypothetical protein